MRSNIAMPPLHASPCIVSARPVSVLGVRLAAGAIAISPLHPNGWCFGLLCWFLRSLFQSCANGRRCAWDCGVGATGIVARTSWPLPGETGRNGEHWRSVELKRLLDTAPEFPKAAGRGRLGSYVPSRAGRRVGRGRLGALAPDCDDSGHDRWSDEQSDQAKRLQAAKDAEENPQERQASRRADQRRADEMIGNEDHD